jgi:hypothetical protein
LIPWPDSLRQALASLKRSVMSRQCWLAEDVGIAAYRHSFLLPIIIQLEHVPDFVDGVAR